LLNGHWPIFSVTSVPLWLSLFGDRPMLLLALTILIAYLVLRK
jgi:hypothetical protein